MSNPPNQRPNGSQAPSVTITVMPNPVPTQVVVEQVDGPDGLMVALRFFTPTGQAVYFLPTESAKQVAQMIQARATSIRVAR